MSILKTNSLYKKSATPVATLGKTFKIKLCGAMQDHNKYGQVLKLFSNEKISTLFSCKLTMITEKHDVTKEILLGENITVEIGVQDPFSGKEHKRQFNGIIESVDFEVKDLLYYELHLVPKLKFLNKTKHCRVFQKNNQNVLDVVEKILNRHKIAYKIDPNLKNREQFTAINCIQYHETDFAFIERLLQVSGLFYFFKHDNNQHTMIISNQISSYDDLSLTVNHYSQQQFGQSILEMKQKQKISHAKFVVAGLQLNNLANAIVGEHTIEQKNKLALNLEHEIYGGALENNNQAKLLAQNISHKLKSEQILLHGKSSYIAFYPGVKFILNAEHFSDYVNYDHKYVVVELKTQAYNVEHNQAHNGLCYQNEFTAMKQEEIFIDNKLIKKPSLLGLHFATVVNGSGKNDSGEQIFCDKQVKISIKFDWELNNEKDREYQTCNAAMVFNNDIAIPRVGTKVMVYFPNDDCYNDVPIVMGAFANGQNGILDLNDSENNYKRILQTWPGIDQKTKYSQIIFHDQEQKELLTFKAGKDLLTEVAETHTIDIKKDEISTINNDRKVILLEGSDSLNINKGDLIVGIDNGKYHIKTKQNIEIETEADLILKANGNIKIQSEGNLEVSANGDSIFSSKQNTSIESMNVNVLAKKNISMDAKIGFDCKSGTTMNLATKASFSLDALTTSIQSKTNVTIKGIVTSIG